MATTYTELLQLPKHATTDPFDITLINNMADLIDAAVAKSYRGKAAHNLITNGDFRQAINQRGLTTGAAGDYALDRWKVRANNMTLTTSGEGLTITGAGTTDVAIYQKLFFPLERLLGNTFTVAVCDGSGQVACVTVTLPTSVPTGWQTIGSAASVGNVGARIFHNGESKYGFCFNVGRVNGNAEPAAVRWAALYEGSYTLDTLPNYQPKEHAVELAACQRHYVPTFGQGWGYAISTTTARLNIPVPADLHSTPSIDRDDITWTVRCNGVNKTISNYSVEGYKAGVVRLTLVGESGTFTNNHPVVAYPSSPFGFSSDI